ncbi:MAG TPA: (Fe-S)-binding protein [Candidatus Dormibacteraeota bacterium]|nr:(Fe-S)-binding protein [Candidatus Dormibacteraeota bacterium]
MAVQAIDVKNAGVFQGPDAPSDDDLSTCVHCGLCLNYCPTYRATSLETESPRGRIYLMTQWQRGELPFTADLARHIDLCLGCRTCESVCPSGVPYGRIIEHGRAEVERLRGFDRKRTVSTLAMRALLPHPARLRAAGVLTRAAQAVGLTSLVPQGRQLPRLHAPYRPPAGSVAPAIGPRRHRVAFLTGCVMPIMFPESHAAAVKLLQLAGCEVWFPPDQRCCGALFAHNGDLETARSLRDENQAVFDPKSFDVLVVDSAGCSSHLKDFYSELGPKTRDLFEFLAQAGLPEPKHEVRLRVTYQDPCHLAHAQRITRQPRDLLRAVPGVDFVEMPHADICCGSAGIYSTLEPEMSERILDEKLGGLLSVDPEVVVTANPGCQMQLLAGLKSRGRSIPVWHLAELIARAY